MKNNSETIKRIYDIILSRRKASPDNSYVAGLFSDGLEKIISKVEEESKETQEAGVNESNKELIAESSDLLFHLMVLWAYRGVTPEEVFEELSSREGISGLKEKAARTSNKTK